MRVTDLRPELPPLTQINRDNPSGPKFRLDPDEGEPIGDLWDPRKPDNGDWRE